MKIQDINFLETKKIGEKFISLAHYNNKPVIFNINNLEVFENIYKFETKYYMDFKYETSLVRLLQLLEKYICEHVYKIHNIQIDFNKFLKKTLFSSFIGEELKLEIHKNCLFIEEDDLLNQRQITFKDIKKEDYCNLKIHFVGINFLSSNYEPIFLVRKIVKQIVSDNDFDELILSDDDEEIDIVNKLYNDENITKYILENFEKKEINV